MVSLVGGFRLEVWLNSSVGQPSSAERLLPPSNWQFDDQAVLTTLDSVLALKPAIGFRSIFKKTTTRKPVLLDPSSLHVQSILRRHSASFVDRRDLMEARLWKLNRRLAFLMSESVEWQGHFSLFHTFTTKLASESQQLKAKLDKEKKELKRLSGVVTEQNSAQDQLKLRLIQTTSAHEAALAELQKVSDIQEDIRKQRDAMLHEIQSILPATNDVLSSV